MREAQARGITGTGPSAVRWRGPDPEIAVPPAEVRGLDGEAELDLSGGVVTDLHDRVYARLARSGGQLVLLGDAGAGKTAAIVLMLLDGLARQAEDERLPVPVLLPIGDWDPKTPLAVWVAGRLVEDFPQLRALPGGSAAVVELVQAGRSCSRTG
jgi:hypothetical protein